MKELFIIAGPNGAGKTTAAFTLLPDFIKVNEYVNADSMAYALSPFHPDTVAIQAGRLMLDRINNLASQNKNFAFETTLASKSFIHLIQKCRQSGYKTNLMFLYLHNTELAIERVKLRVSQGGHSIPPNTIIRRYKRGLKNLFGLYMPIIDNWWFYDNSDNSPDLISKKLLSQPLEIVNVELWNNCKKTYG
ncbi:zeta toxin family protein [soil metagenome]